MSNKKEGKLCFPTIIRVKDQNYTLEIPDLNITVSQDNYTSLLAHAIDTLTAIVIYRKERNIPIRIKSTFEEVTLRIGKEKGEHFVYMLSPLDS